MTPFMIVGNYLALELEKGLTNESKELNNQADLLCGDCIMNFKTVQSMGNEDKFLKKYHEYQYPIT